MIISFSIQNFRSIKEKQYFSMEASSSKSKTDNIFEIKLKSGESLTLTKAASIFGANASGKSNIIKAFYNLYQFITNSGDIEIDKPISWYEPFLFDLHSKNLPTEFELVFIGKDLNKYRYFIAFLGEEIIKETLDYYPKKIEHNLFERPYKIIETDENIHVARLSKSLKYKEFNVHKKIPFLSFFRKAENYHAVLSPVYEYFKSIEIWSTLDTSKISKYKSDIIKDINLPENFVRKEKLDRLIRISDTKIQKLRIKSINLEELQVPDKSDRKKYFEYILLRSLLISENYLMYGLHNVYENNEKVSEYELPFNEESAGTNTLLVLGGLILKALEKGETIIFDELDTNLHPRLSRFLVKLFLNTLSNPNNAQLIFTAHETNLLDKDMLRSDQIWFAEKNERGETSIYSAQDFDGVREDIPFDKWYLAGKFGAIPDIQDIQFIFDYEQKK
jgi:AAA15 family ATPase/GTPase